MKRKKKENPKMQPVKEASLKKEKRKNRKRKELRET